MLCILNHPKSRKKCYLIFFFATGLVKMYKGSVKLWSTGQVGHWGILFTLNDLMTYIFFRFSCFFSGRKALCSREDKRLHWNTEERRLHKKSLEKGCAFSQGGWLLPQTLVPANTWKTLTWHRTLHFLTYIKNAHYDCTSSLLIIIFRNIGVNDDQYLQ